MAAGEEEKDQSKFGLHLSAQISLWNANGGPNQLFPCDFKMDEDSSRGGDKNVHEKADAEANGSPECQSL